jgi:hypothetical protein
MDVDFHELYKATMCGTYGALGIKIEIAASALTKEQLMASKRLRDAAYDIERKLKDVLMAESFAVMPEAQERAKDQRTGLLGAFTSAGAIHVEDIPNGYCSDGCCWHLPWFIVTTALGRFKIGWRKSVILLDWSDTKGTKTSEELFQSENVTKDTRYIHAWGYERARAYVDAIVTGVPTTKEMKTPNESAIPA